MSDQDRLNSTTLTPEHILLVSALTEVFDEIMNERSRLHAVRDALGPDALIPYGDFLKANSLSYELGARMRDEGLLKVLRVGTKLMVRAGHASEFVRNLPVDK